MKKIWSIFANDIKNIGTNWVAAILIGGLIILPSLYAWFNIEASWDPYSRTDQLPVAVVNEDSGATVRGEEINVGEDLIEQLKGNEDMDWQFVDRKEAIDKVEYGDYFAAIIIPDDFSSKLGTVVNDEPEKAGMEYYVNEKTNAIAPNITEKGANTIVDQITSEFISTVNGVIFETFNDIGLELEEDLPDIKQFEEYIFEMEESLPEAYDLLQGSLSDANEAQSMINDAQDLLPEAERVTGDGLETIDETSAYLNKAETRLNEIAPQVDQDLADVQSTAEEINEFINSIESSEINLDDGEQLSQQVDEQVEESIVRIETIEAALEQLKQSSGEEESDQEEIDEALEQLGALKENLQAVEDNSSEVRSFLSKQQGEADELISSLQERADSSADDIDAFITEYNESIEPTVREEVASAKTTLTEARAILAEVQSTIPEAAQLLNSTEGSLEEGEETLKYLLGEYPYVNEKINELADRIREIQDETDINEIIELLQNDPEAERGFFQEPVELSKNSLFPMENYGTSMTAFYTVLAIWVGGLLLISLLATGVVNDEMFTEKQVYFGKLLTFVSIGAAQTLVVTLGDLFVVGVDIAEPGWFVVFGMFISLVFLLIVYTLVSVFGDTGKAMAIVLLVLQIAGSGGTYPVALLPDFFQTIHPFLPFSYAVDLMRESVGGIVWERVYRDIVFLSLFGFAGLLAGTFLKQLLHKKTQALMKKSKESGLFH
ncbi:YhgE/Pip family protein [Halobacillus sp. A5]|uniref:YhgE/Pip family protein n=1 Tax=Halobacillus sp. A5 TaxID=2880263 RepID=UPI0020A6504D|nr:YhgE/Pip domain-containing protein [Halobacillus sp. A5]